MAEITPKKQEQEQKQTQEQQQETIEKIINELKNSNILKNIYNNYRIAVYNPHGLKETEEVIHYLVNTTMHKYLYNIVRAYAIATFLHPKKVKNLISNLIKKLEAERPEDVELPGNKPISTKEETIYFVFDDKLFLTTLLAQLLYKRNITLVTYLKLYYYFKLTEELENADVAVATFYINLLYILKNNIDEGKLYDTMPELMRDLHNYDIGTKMFKREEILEELKQELKARNEIEIRNKIIDEIKYMLKYGRMDNQFILKLEQQHKSKELVKVYKLLKKLVNYDEYDLIELEPVKTPEIKQELGLDEHEKEDLKVAVEDFFKAAKYFRKLFELEKYFSTYEETNIYYKSFEETLIDYLDEINIVKQGIFKYLVQQQQ